MSITTATSSTRRWPNFTTEMRRTLVINLMANNRSIRDEFESRVDHYRALGVTSVDDLASAITPIGNRLWGYLTKFHNEVEPARSAASIALERGGLDAARQTKLQQLIQIADKFRNEVQREGLILDNTVTYRRLAKGGSRGNAKSITQFESGFDDLLADNAFLLDQLELEVSDEG